MTRGIFTYSWDVLCNFYKMLERSVRNGDSIEKTETIQEIAVKLVEEQMRLLRTNGGNATKENTIFMLGSKGAGKTTILNRFFDRDENTRPTLALEYSYGRRTGAVSVSHPQQLLPQKQVLNVWELGSLDNAEQLIGVPLRTHGIENLSVIIVLDLSQPQRVWLDLECAYRGLRHACNNILSTNELQSSRERLASQRLKKEHNDVNTQELMPFPVVIVGGKYDVFMNFDPEVKKHICRCLRSMAHLMGGALLFYANNQPKLTKMLRDTISHFGFGSPAHPFRQHITDYNEALTIWFGHDTWQQISPQTNDSTQWTVEYIGSQLAAAVPQVQTANKSELVDPAKDPGFRESVIDDMRAQMDEQLRSIARESQLRGKFEPVTDEY